MRGWATLWVWQRTGSPRRQIAHAPQGTRHEMTTRSSGRTEVTARPTCSTTPAPSCPRRIGKAMLQPFVILTWRSVWQTPLAARRTRISSSPRSSKAIGSTATLSPAAFSIAPRSLTARGYALRFYRTVVWYIVPARGTAGGEAERASDRAAAAASVRRAREIHPRSGAPHLPPEGLPRRLDAEHRGCRGPLQGQPLLLRFLEGGATRSTVRGASRSS